MNGKLNHLVLIVDDEENIGRIIERMLRPIAISAEYVTDAEQALLKMRKAARPYSIVISDQRMPGMTGNVFLEKASVIAPDTVRFLMSGYTDLDAVIQTVNKGAIHRFVSKPWNDDEFIKAVLAGIEQFESGFETKRLFELAKKQNLKLLQLNQGLKKETKEYETSLDLLDREIREVNQAIEALKNPDLTYKNAVDRIEQYMKKNNILTQGSFERVHAQIKEELMVQFREIAVRNGLTMPEINL